MNRIIEKPPPKKPDIRDSFMVYRRPRPPPPENTDDTVDCTPYNHVHYRPFCQTIRLAKRRKAYRRIKVPRLPLAMENYCMFDWLHEVGAHKYLTKPELIFILTNGLFHQDGDNAAIVFNKDERTGKSATSRMNAAFGKAEKKEDALKEWTEAENSPKVNFNVPDNFIKYGVGTSLHKINCSDPPLTDCGTKTCNNVEVVTLD
uniref:SCP domain-containing protein n=1 Tax=Caenorhabditis tropicalis TaxID=1561998 RepID=A0A1I7TBU2_9PELO